MTVESPAAPTAGEWRRHGIRISRELHAGKQSRVFDAVMDGRRVAIKLIDAQLVDLAVLASRREAVERLSRVEPVVVAPIRVDDTLVQQIGGWSMTVSRFADGEHPDGAETGVAEQMGRTLARLHAAMRRVGPFDVPPIAALETTHGVDDRSEWQLLHGDFSDRNVITTPHGSRVVDFDDSGLGPVEYDIANSIYMIQFDAEVNDRPVSPHRFRDSLVAGYGDLAERPIDDHAVDRMIAIRIEALGRWLDDLTSAPIGIRTSSPSWRSTLRRFERSRRPGASA